MYSACTSPRIVRSWLDAHPVSTKSVDPLFAFSTDTHNREGMYAVAVLVFVVVITLLGFFFYHFIKSVTTGGLG